MKKLLLSSILMAAMLFTFGQNYDPYVKEAAIDGATSNPAPLLPWEFSGTGTFSFKVGNPGTVELPLTTNQEMTMVVTLSYGEPVDVDPFVNITTFSGDLYNDYFSWSWNATTSSYFAKQKLAIPAGYEETFYIDYKVTQNSPESNTKNGFNVNLQPPAYTGGSNNTEDDATSLYTYVQALDYGDAPISYGEVSHEINLFTDPNDTYYLNNVYLGSSVDQEDSYQGSTDATGDDVAGTPDDEDGVTFPDHLYHGQPATIEIVYNLVDNMQTLDEAKLNVWIDWNIDGNFDATEWVASNITIDYFTNFEEFGTYYLDVVVPDGAKTGLTFARFSLGSGGTTEAEIFGASSYGEIEDYQINLEETSDLSLVKIVSDPNPKVGDIVTFTLTIFNAGPDIATGVSVEDVLPNGYGAPTNTNPVVVPSGSTITWTELTVPANGDIDVTFQAEVLAPDFLAPAVPLVEYENYAQITASDQYDPDSDPTVDGGGTEDDEDTQSVTPQQADLELTKVVNDDTPQVGDIVTFTLTLTNNGPDDASAIKVSEALPNGYTYIDHTIPAGDENDYDPSAGVAEWDIASLANGASTTLIIQAEVLATVTTGLGSDLEYNNYAQVTASDQWDPNSAPNNGVQDPDENDDDNASVNPQIADLSLTKTVDEATPHDGEPHVGEDVIFTITVSNAGEDVATNIDVLDNLPSGYTYVSHNATVGELTYDPISGIWGIDAINASADATLYITATVNATGDYVNVAEVVAVDQWDPDSEPNNDVLTEDDQDSEFVDPQIADLQLTKSVFPTNPNVDGTVVFTITVLNAGPDNATGVTVQDLLPDGFTYVSDNSATTTTTTTRVTGTIDWTIGAITNGQTISLEITATVVAPTGTANEYLNYAVISNSDQYDDVPGNNYGEAEVFPQQADLSLVKSVSPESPQVGETVTFKLAITNAGPDAATNVSVKDVLPNGYDISTLTSVTPIYTDLTGSTMTWDLANVAVGTTYITFDIDVLAPDVEAVVIYENYAQITASDQYDPDSEPNNGNATDEDDEDTQSVTPQVADLVLTKVANNMTPQVNEEIIFTLEVTNNGPSIATNVSVTDLLPSGFTYVSHTSTEDYNTTAPNIGLWTIGNIAPSTSVTLNITAIVNGQKGTVPVLDYVNIAEVTSSDQWDPTSIPDNFDTTPDEDDEDNVIVDPQFAALVLTKIVSDDTPNVGDPIIFTLTVTNSGPDEATNVLVNDLLPNGYAYVSHTKSDDTDIYDESTGDWQIGTLANSETAELFITVEVLEPGTGVLYSNYAQVTGSDQYDPNSTPGDDSNGDDDDATKSITPQQSDLVVTKTVTIPTPYVGDDVTFTVTVTNYGPDAATGVVVTDQVPSGYNNVQIVSVDGTSYTVNTGIWDIGTIAAPNLDVLETPVYQSAILTITATVLATGDYDNIAQVTASDQFDPTSTPDNDVPGDDDQDNATVTTLIRITGTVFDDANRLDDNTVNGNGEDLANTQIYVYLIDPDTDEVLAKVPVANDGTYAFDYDDGVLKDEVYNLIIATDVRAVDDTLTVSVLDDYWINTGENVGSGIGSDGTPDGILTVTTSTDNVPEANFGIRNVPDVTPVITAIPNVMHGVTNFNITVRVTELNSIATEGLITVKIPKDVRWDLTSTYDAGATVIGTIAVNNGDWTHDDTDANFHIFTTPSVGYSIAAGQFSTFGFQATFDPGQTQGLYTITSQIVSYSGGEVRINNNVDAEKLDYFIY